MQKHRCIYLIYPLCFFQKMFYPKLTLEKVKAKINIIKVPLRIDN